jgi:hypothetical protein
MPYGKQSSCAFEQCQGGGPGSNVNHVNAQYRIRRLQGPRESGYIKVNREIDVREPFLFNAPGNGLAKLRIWIGGLPSEAWERLGEMDDVLSRPAGDL